MSTSPHRRSNIRTFAAWAVASVSIVLAMLFAGLLLRDPSLVSAWVGLACFGIAAVGAVTTVELERRARRN
ncbi:hypothetical protein FVA74_08165 [Salinibacterium sp. dk2585]|uniref:hypothetical protein n=1 Tax=unclassified Salinibacterium TaxID=2632331 RepID=UPI0011C25750|nr:MULTISPECIES: hypothetical protein [unclassified Salinibacterium]QEE61553.1 hypothetical protein FVA74_08165 [Salinibacterium sp. dk2585]TXK52478.1 hypothetical protein FVP63_12925 [Salinibacterium sp. dk5596]